MKVDGTKPAIGTASMMLGARPSDIPVDAAGMVHPRTGGVSVFAAIHLMPARLVPRRLQSLVPGAAGNNNLAIWSMGTGVFTDGPLRDGLYVRVDLLNNSHGFVEPDAMMRIEEYQDGLARTRDEWVEDEK